MSYITDLLEHYFKTYEDFSVISDFKGNAQFIFLCNSHKSLVYVFLVRNIKNHCHKKSNCGFRWRKLLKVAVFFNITNFHNGFFWNPSKIQRSLLNELRVSFNENETSLAVDSCLDEQMCKNIKNKSCFKSVKRSSIDLILTSRPSLRQFTNIIETGVSDHHLSIYIILKSTYTKIEPNVLTNRYFKNFLKQSSPQDLN